MGTLVPSSRYAPCCSDIAAASYRGFASLTVLEPTESGTGSDRVPKSRVAYVQSQYGICGAVHPPVAPAFHGSHRSDLPSDQLLGRQYVSWLAAHSRRARR